MGPDMMRLRRHDLRVINAVIVEDRSRVGPFPAVERDSGVPTEGERRNHRTPERPGPNRRAGRRGVGWVPRTL